MDILVVSDNHGSEEVLKQVLDRHQGEVSAVLHCGDSEATPDNKLLNDMHIVQGNVDSPGNFPDELTVDVGHIKTYLTHGHLYQVKTSYASLFSKAEQINADLVCSGHTHVAGAFEEDGTIFVNPGSLLLPQERPEQTYAIVNVSNQGQSINVHFYERESGSELLDLSQSFPFPEGE